MNPALILLLSESAGAQARAFTDLLAARLGAEGRYRVLALGELRRAGLDGSITHPLHRIDFERFIARELARLLAGPLAPRARVPLFVVGNLAERSGRRHAWSLVPVLLGALSRVAMPRGVDAILAGVWAMPATWSPAEGAELFAWLKEFARATAPVERNGTAGPYGIATVLGRSDAHETASATSGTRGDAEIMALAAELIAACCGSRLIDWVLAARRGHPRSHGFHAFGIEALGSEFANVLGNGRLERVVQRSRVLWPVDTSTPAGIEPARAIAASTEIAESLPGWQHVESLRAADARAAGWIVQMARGLEPRQIIGAPQWRRFYELLSPERRRDAHTLAEAVDWTDPLDVPPARARQTRDEPPPML